MNKKIVSMMLLTIFFWCLVPLTGMAAQESQPRTVRVGYYTTPGFQEYDEETGTYSGYSYEYLLAIAQYANWEYEFVPVGFSDGVKMLENGELDLMNNVSRTAEREESLDFSTLSSGENCAYLVMQQGDTRVAFEDFDNISKLKIGLVTTSLYSEKLVAYCTEHNCNPSYVFFDTKEEAQTALEKGEIDARVITSSQNIEMHIIGKFAPESFYFATTKGNDELLYELNGAMNSIVIKDPSFETRLNSKYYSNQSEKYVVLTDAEKEFVEENPVIPVLYDANCYPLSYTGEDGTMQGAMADIYELLAKRTGLTFSFTPGNSHLAEDAMNSLADPWIMAEQPYDYIWAAQYDAKLTQPFTSVSVMEVRRQDESVQKVAREQNHWKETMAVVDGYYLNQLCRDTYKDQYDYVEYRSSQECIDAVLSGQADVTCMMSYEYSYYQSQAKYRSLNFMVSRELKYDLSIAVSGAANPCLYSIMMKGLDAISEDEINYILRETVISVQNPDFLTLLYAHPEGSILFILLMGFLIASVIFFSFHMRAMHRRNKDTQRQNLALQKAVEEAEEASEAKSDFLSRMSHEIRTPMNAILGMSVLGSEDAADPTKAKEYFDKIQTSGEYLLGLINDILDMSRIESGRLELHPELVNGPEFLNHIVEMMRPLVKEKNIQLIADFAKAQTPWVMMDKLRSEQIYVNLLSNAIKFSENGGTVEWTIEDTILDANHMQMVSRITDHGCGMSESFIPHVFEPFEQEYNKFSKERPGTGLGLAIVKNIVDKMNGTIRVESRINQGTTFILSLPRQWKRENEKSVKVQKTFHKEALAGKKLLLAEDNEINALIATNMLKKWKCLVDWQKNGKLALEAYLNHPDGYYDGILMDIRMPMMNGLEVTQQIRTSKRNDGSSIPIIAMTANAFEEDERRGMQVGMNAYLAKPIDVLLLYSTLVEQLEIS